MAPIKVVLGVFSNNPACQHGPTVLLQRTNAIGELQDQFYACTASRDGTCCLKVAKCFTSKNTISNRRAQIFNRLKLNPNYLETKEPTHQLAPLNFDGEEAQYFFTNNALSCFTRIFTQIGITKVLCIGAPRMHEHLLQKTSIHSLLLDIDDRFHEFYNNAQFIHYNMFNHHFFRGKTDEKMFDFFLKNIGSTSRICIFTDPPFGCRTELLANTIRTINHTYNRINSFVQQILPTFWIFPYFMETYIRQEMPSMEMTDYQVSYTNHEKYCEDSKAQKNGSPVRMFTNVPLSLIRLPTKEGYKFCEKCNKSVNKSNKHCVTCKACTSKNGATYKHCAKCNICVKPTYLHCIKCGRCAQLYGHNCHTYKNMVSCRICLSRGHLEKSCSFWKRYGKTGMFQVGCAVCGSKAHIVRDCSERKLLIKEVYFLGKFHNSINEEI